MRTNHDIGHVAVQLGEQHCVYISKQPKSVLRDQEIKHPGQQTADTFLQAKHSVLYQGEV